MQTLLELLHNMSQSSVQGMFGVAGIFLYFIAIISVSCYRIKQNLEEEKRHPHH
ncbi:MAG: hypothetical protein Q9M37_10925 [Desulfonauticus sp.]|nr:hypothetical protein [Desulfonauticus sp.]